MAAPKVVLKSPGVRLPSLTCKSDECSELKPFQKYIRKDGVVLNTKPDPRGFNQRHKSCARGRGSALTAVLSHVHQAAGHHREAHEEPNEWLFSSL